MGNQEFQLHLLHYFSQPLQACELCVIVTNFIDEKINISK